MMRKAVRENPGLRRHCAGRPRPVYLGRDAARVLSEHTYRDRPDRAVHRAARNQKGRASVRWRGVFQPGPTARELAVKIAPYLRGRVSTQEPLDCELHRCAGCAAICQLDAREGARVSGHELPRSLYPHQDSAAVCSMGGGCGSGCAEEADTALARRVSRAVRATTITHSRQRIRRRCAMRARLWC